MALNPLYAIGISMTQDPLRDEDLVLQAQRGDEAAFAELVHRHEHRVYTLALGMLHNPADAEDILQETFISALRGLQNFRGDASFATWLYRIAYNATLMKLRKASPAFSLDETFEGDENDLPRELADWSHDPVDAALNQETRAVMDQAVAALSAGARAVFIMRDVDGLSTEETATALGISVEAVKVRLHRARLALREYLAPYFSTRRSERKEVD
jgi:RNA polymerase sigma-70 factor (ECF subfamily)